MRTRVDHLAKMAAESVSIGQVGRDWLQLRFEEAKQLAICVGRLTYEAGAHKLPSGEVVSDSVRFDGSVRRPRRQIHANAGSQCQSQPQCPTMIPQVVPCSTRRGPPRVAQTTSAATRASKRSANARAALQQVVQQDVLAIDRWLSGLNLNPSTQQAATSRMVALRERVQMRQRQVANTGSSGD